MNCNFRTYAEIGGALKRGEVNNAEKEYSYCSTNDRIFKRVICRLKILKVEKKGSEGSNRMKQCKCPLLS